MLSGILLVENVTDIVIYLILIGISYCMSLVGKMAHRAYSTQVALLIDGNCKYCSP